MAQTERRGQIDQAANATIWCGQHPAFHALPKLGANNSWQPYFCAGLVRKMVGSSCSAGIRCGDTVVSRKFGRIEHGLARGGTNDNNLGRQSSG
jgi:hypothetical protein